MYSIVTTDGFVIDSRPYGDAGKLLYIFTRDHGLIMATAQGIRLEKSKLRPFIQDYSFGTYSFVRGKEYWRLTGAENTKGAVGTVGVVGASGVAGDYELRAKIALILKKMLHGEEANEKLFLVLEPLISAGGEDVNEIESLLVARIFDRLGYMARIPELAEIIDANHISDTALKIVAENRKTINQHINKAIKESQL